MTKGLSHHITLTWWGMTTDDLALGMQRQQAKDGYDYTKMCMFMRACLLIDELLSLRNSQARQPVSHHLKE
jgi:hypothetical protein